MHSELPELKMYYWYFPGIFQTPKGTWNFSENGGNGGGVCLETNFGYIQELSGISEKMQS